ncbi:hypothetical protein DSM112329_02671 [Paraconexibacter sp. AEG42_29]|uniref:ABC transporter permease n=1 Tax=Paraconexibacter sp. AEG42_29 TaxID=2997339 RepID=A0AAU7AW42_9ACTN
MTTPPAEAADAHDLEPLVSSASGGAPGSRERLKAVRGYIDRTVAGATLGQRAETVYVFVLTCAIFGTGLFDAVHSALAEVMSTDGTATWGPAVVLLGVVVTARWGAYQGPVVFAVADVAHLLGAPLSRRGLAARRLGLALAVGALVGLALGAVAVVGIAGHDDGISAARGAGLIAALGAVGVIAVAAAWCVQASARVERVLGPLTWVVLVVGAGAGALGRTNDAVRDVELWSGPWGWAVTPVHSAQWPIGLALVVVTAAAAAAAVLRRCGNAPTERHLRRAEARAGAAASLAGFDARSTRRALRDVAARKPPRATGRLHFAGRGRLELLIAWRGATALRRTPARAAEALVVAGGAVALLLTASDRATAGLIGGLLLYVAATRVLEPLREEIDMPGRARLLMPFPWGRILVGHVVLPLVLLLVAAGLAVAICVGTGSALPDAGALAVVAVLGVVPATLAAALSARRGGRLPVSVLSMATGSDMGGSGGFVIVGWLLMWPLVAVIGAGAPAAIVAGSGVDALQPALTLELLMSAILITILRRSKRP